MKALTALCCAALLALGCGGAEIDGPKEKSPEDGCPAAVAHYTRLCQSGDTGQGGMALCPGFEFLLPEQLPAECTAPYQALLDCYLTITNAEECTACSLEEAAAMDCLPEA